jgi:hypothetical protein
MAPARGSFLTRSRCQRGRRLRRAVRAPLGSTATRRSGVPVGRAASLVATGTPSPTTIPIERPLLRGAQGARQTGSGWWPARTANARSTRRRRGADPRVDDDPDHGQRLLPLPEERITGRGEATEVRGARGRINPIADLLVSLVNRRFEEMTHAIDPELSKIKKPLDLLFKKDILISFPTAELLQKFPEFAQRWTLLV